MTTPSLQWSSPVVILIAEEPQRQRVIASVIEAADFLTREWPVKDRGRWYRIALETCQDCLSGDPARCYVDSARSSFINAAQHAGIYVHPAHFPQ